MSELKICKYCGKPIMRGEVWNPDENGNGYHHACLIDIEFNENKKRVERLAQKSILDKIRAEIDKRKSTIDKAISEDELKIEGMKEAYTDCLEIIDNCKAESEE